MPFQPPNQQRQSTEGNIKIKWKLKPKKLLQFNDGEWNVYVVIMYVFEVTYFILCAFVDELKWSGWLIVDDNKGDDTNEPRRHQQEQIHRQAAEWRSMACACWQLASPAVAATDPPAYRGLQQQQHWPNNYYYHYYTSSMASLQPG